MRTRKIKKKAFAAIAVFVLVLSALLMPCLAAGAKPVLPDEAVDTINTLPDKITEFYNFVVSISFPIATVAVALFGLEGLIGGQRETERAVTGIKWILISLVIMLLLPGIISMFIGLFKTYEWNPMTYGGETPSPLPSP